MTKRFTTAKPIENMTRRELNALTIGLDEEFVADTFRPLTPAERKFWNGINRKLGRPQTGKGAKVISLSLERGLLEETDKLAKKLKVSRSQLVADGLKAMLAKLARKKAG